MEWNETEVTQCPHCKCMTHTPEDDAGNKYCGKCKKEKPKGD